MYTKLASAIYNDVMGGLRGISSNPSLSLEQLEDDIVDERLQIIKEYALKGVTPYKDLMMSIKCLQLDCASIDRCCNIDNSNETIPHFEIPQILMDFGLDAISYLGATDLQLPFVVYTNITQFKAHKYRKRAKSKPYVFIDTTPNKNNMYDAWVYNAPLLKSITIIAIFKDPRQVMEYNCCSEEDLDNISFLNNEIKKRLTEKKLRYYRQLASAPVTNDQVAR